MKSGNHPLGPEGVRTHDDSECARTLERIDQVLTEANFRQVRPGLTITEVRRMLRPATARAAFTARARMI